MKLLRWLNENIEKVVIVLVTAATLAILTIQIVSRYVFNASISWGEELAIFGVVWLAYFGASQAAMQRRHIRITAVTDLFSPKARKGFDIFTDLVFLIFIIFLVYGTYNMAAIAFETNQKAAASGMPRWIALAGLPLAFALTAVRLMQDLRKQFKEYRILASGGTLENTKPVISIKLED